MLWEDSEQCCRAADHHADGIHVHPSARLEGLQNLAQEVLISTPSDGHKEGASEKHAVQEFCRPLRRNQTAHFMPGSSEGKPPNLDDPLRQALGAITEPQKDVDQSKCEA